MFKIYHDCGFVRVDETRNLIEFKRGGSCICASDYPFWKRPQDCKHTGIKTRSIVKIDRIKKANKWTRNRYFRELVKKMTIKQMKNMYIYNSNNKMF